MAKKRKSDASRLDEVDRSIYTSFCSTANSLSQLYTQSMNQQKLSFQAGERHGLEKLYNWIVRQQEDGPRVNTVDIVTYLQNELDYGIEDAPMSPRLPFQHQLPQTAMHSTNTGFSVSSSSFGQLTAGQGLRGHSDHQPKNSVFSNALSSPVRRGLQQYHMPPTGFSSSNIMPSGNVVQSHESIYPPHQVTSVPGSTDSMDIHTDSPGRETSY
ncbi:uncharacterized protein LOC127800664 [Diospyros lotus]|uniref:uncharacterized protein LOC127800664 n=1 Tax=Diospyros lotus TaxID=55363 RepID=UPI00225496B4|nr:uncharacterized protein LOC127800664 [Diospyros lotus]